MAEKTIIFCYTFNKWYNKIETYAMEVKETNKLFMAIKSLFPNYLSKISKELLDKFQESDFGNRIFMISRSDDKLDYFKSELVNYYTKKMDKYITLIIECQEIIDKIQKGD